MASAQFWRARMRLLSWLLGGFCCGRRVAHSGMFSDTNRLGVPGSLHRISAMKDRQGVVYGLTYRVGRHVPGEQKVSHSGLLLAGKSVMRCKHTVAACTRACHPAREALHKLRWRTNCKCPAGPWLLPCTTSNGIKHPNLP